MLRRSQLAFALAVTGTATCWLAFAGPDQSGTQTTNAPVARAGADPVTIVRRTPHAHGGGENVLHYEDVTLGVSAYTDALVFKGWASLFTPDAATFAAQLLLDPSPYTHVIAAHQNTSGPAGYEDALLTWIANNPGKPVLISDWRVGTPQPYLATLGFGYTGSTNDPLVRPVPDQCLAGLPIGNLVSPGWGIFSYGVTGPNVLAGNGIAEPAIVSNDGNVCFNGWLSDTFADPIVGRDYVCQELEGCHGDPCDDCPCPEDINRDGKVDTADLIRLLSAWGPCPDERFACDFPGECGTYEQCTDDPICLCFRLSDGSGWCGRGDVPCDVPDCVDGRCPPGFVCQVDSCCGRPICVPIETGCPTGAAPQEDLPPGTRTNAGVVGKDGAVILTR